MHICSLNMPNEFYSPASGGAVATVIMQQTRQLLRLGHRATVLTPVNGDVPYSAGNVVPLHFARRETLPPVRRRLLALRDRLNHWDIPYYAAYRDAFIAHLRTLQPDVVIVHNDLVSPIHIRRALPSATILAWLHNENRVHPTHIPAAVAATSHFVAVSSYIRDWTRAQYSLRQDQITAVINGADTDRFSPRPDFLAPVPILRALFVGRFDPNKGPDLAIDAVKHLRAQGLPVELTVAGDTWWYRRDTDESPYVSSLRESMTAPGIRHAGLVNRNDIPALMRAHDVACVFSRSHDPCPLVPLEAMASGCAVLASDRGGIPEACSTGATLINPDHPTEIHTALRALVENPALLAQRKQAALARAHAITWSHHASHLLALLTSLCKTAPESAEKSLSPALTTSTESLA